MNKKKKVVLIISIALVAILLIVGVSYAAMSYNKAGSNQQLVLGDIWMKYEELNGLSISDAVPGSNYSNYFEFTISGTNTYTKKDIYYDFLLVRGDLPSGKTEENRIPDEYLKFKLVSVDSSNQETEIFTDKTYPSLENTRIYVETIGAGVTNYSKTYRLYMTIDNSLLIGNSNDTVFTFSEWESAFASVKVDVTGNFLEKKILTYNDCFKTNTLSDGTLQITDYYKYGEYNYSTSSYNENSLCTSDVVIPSEIDGVSVTNIGDSAFYNNHLTSVVIPDSVVHIGNAAFNRNDLPDAEATIYKRTDNNNDGIAEIDNTTIVSYGGLNKTPVISNNVTTIGNSAFSSNSLTSVVIPSSVTSIGDYSFTSNSLTSINIPNSVTTIGNSAFLSNSLTSVTFEENSNVEKIGDYAFQVNSIKSVKIPNGVTTIGESAFGGNPLINVEIPNSVITIEDYAFAVDMDSLDSLIITIGSSIQYIGRAAFYPMGSSCGSAGCNSIAIEFTGHTCNEIKNIQSSSFDTTKYFPWLYEEEPYYDEDFDGSVIGTDGKCSY